MVVLKPHKVDCAEEVEYEAGEVVSTDAEVLDMEDVKKKTARRKRQISNDGYFPERTLAWRRYRQWRFCKVLLMDPYFQRKVTHAGNHKLLQISNMHRSVMSVILIFCLFLPSSN